MGKILRIAEYVFTGISLFILSEAVLLLIISNGANESDVEVTYDTSLYKLAFIAIYLVTVLLLAYRWKKTLYMITQGVVVFSLIVFAVASILWSSAPDATLKESINLVGSSLFGLYLSTRYSLKQLLLILAWVFGISIILSFLFAILLPKYGLMGGIHSGVWRGVYIHKNGLGIGMVNSLTILLIIFFNNQRHKWIPFLGIVLAFILLLLCKSTSSLLNSIFIIAAFLTLQTMRWNYRLMVLSISILIIISTAIMTYLFNNSESIAGSLGKDLTFSGRTTLWAAAWEMIQRKLWLGYGYDGFWQGRNGESAYIWLATGWKMTHPHNGFIALWLDLGLVGLVVFLISFTQNLSRSLLLIRLSNTSITFFPILSFLFLFTSNLTETSLPFHANLSCSLYIFLTLTLSRELRDANLFRKKSAFSDPA